MSKTAENEGGLVYIEWCDAMINNNVWMSTEEAIEWADEESWIVQQVGFILKETEKYILLASKKNIYDKENPEVGSVIKIPTTWVLKRVNLDESIK